MRETAHSDLGTVGIVSGRTVLVNPLAGMPPNALGAVYMVIGSLGYVTNDALIRVATAEGLDVYQALCLRGIGMTVLFAALLKVRGVVVTRSQFSRPVFGRVGAEVVGTALFFTAIVNLEFANAQTILLIVPFAVTIAAAVVLGETVSALQYVTVVAGFVGVICVVQPGTGAFSPWSLAVVVSAAALTFREFATRRVDKSIPAAFVGFVTALALTAMTGALAVFTGWNPINSTAALVVAAACLCLVVGYVFTIQTVRIGDISVSAPFRYTTLLGAVVLGYAFFDEIPNTLTIIGCTIILASGIYAIRLERAAQRITTDPAPTTSSS